MEQFRLLALAREIGFSHCGLLDPRALVLNPKIREMCSTDRCGAYGHSWSCPPACGDLDTLRKRIQGYDGGILVQTTGVLADAFDMAVMGETERVHKRLFDTLTRQAKQLFPHCLPMSAGSCTRCKQCTYPNRPCRYPDRVYPSMEAYGLWVSEVCRQSGLAYYYGENTITYTACILTDRQNQGA